MKKVLRVVFVVALIMVVFGCMMLSNYSVMKDYKDGNITDINTLAQGDMEKGQLLKGTMDTNWGTFAEEYETKYGIRTSSDSTKLFYLIDMRDYYVIYVTSDDDVSAQLDTMSDELLAHCKQLDDDEDVFENWKPTHSIELEGRAVEMDDEVQGYCKEMLDQLTGDGAAEMAYVAGYMVQDVSFKGLSNSFYIGIVVAALGLVILIVLAVGFFRARRASSRTEFY